MLEEDYRIICEEKGISASVNLTRAKELDVLINKVRWNNIFSLRIFKDNRT